MISTPYDFIDDPSTIADNGIGVCEVVPRAQFG